MRTIPRWMLDKMLSKPYYKRCARRSSQCDGRITLEHALIHAGKQINEEWAIVPLCWYHHLGAGLVKEINELIALQRATPDDLAKYPKRDWAQRRKYLETKYKVINSGRSP